MCSRDVELDVSGSLKLLALHNPAVFDDLGAERSLFRHIVTHDAEVTEQNEMYAQQATERSTARNKLGLTVACVFVCVRDCDCVFVYL